MQVAAYAIAEADLIPHPEYPNHYTVTSYLAEDSRVSILPTGEVSARPNSTEIGPWELCQKVGSKLVWKSSAYPTGTYALPLAEGV